MSALSPLRAGLTPPAGARVQSQSPAQTPALAGQAAFFRAAMGQSAEPAKAQEAAAAAPKPQTSKPEIKLAEGEMPSRLLRPGSLLDIRV